jgi:regulator of protease activity HflC (stomatin/prohibitin superfamily)
MSPDAWPIGPAAIIASAIGVLVLAYLLMGVRRVPDGEAWTVERMGRYARTLPPGMNFILPMFERVGRKVPTSEQGFEISGQEVRTADDVVLRVGGFFAYRVVDAARAATDVADLASAMATLAAAQLREAIAGNAFADLPARRGDMQRRLLGAADDAARGFGVKVVRAEMGDIVLPASAGDSAPIVPPPVR